MTIKRNATFKTHNQTMSIWTIITIWLCIIQPSYLNDDLYLPENTSQHARQIKLNKFKFKHTVYNVTIPENSLGKTYVKPISHEDLMGIVIDRKSDVKYRIISGDRDKLFKAEERIVGDIAFLTIRTRTSNVVLNREKNEDYILKIRATINYNNKETNLSDDTETLVHIKVLDRNDLSPLFYPTEYSHTVPEDMPIHKSILRVLAEDADIGINGEIYYSFLSDNDYFSIHLTTGVITLTRSLKYALNSHFEMTVLANDRGSGVNHYSQQSSKAKVSIVVEQVNLYAPEIYYKILTSISINFTTEVCGIVRVSDKDIGRHGEIKRLQIVNGDPDDNFRIKPTKTEGEFYIEVNKFAKLNNSVIYNLTLRAEDNGVPIRFSYKIVPVEIIKESNNSPVFTKQLYEVSIPETSPPNMPVIRLKVTDPDLGKNALVYLEIVGGNEGGEFRINPDSGMLYTQKHIDAESKSFYTLTVSAIDQANVGVRKQSSAKVKVNVQDMNDNDPIFEKVNTTLEIDENELAGMFVIKLTAKDKDTGENSYISYSIANLNDVPFEIDHFTGVIRTATLIDFETMRREYILSIRASDWGLPFRRQSELELLIKIKDVNDNRPQFERVNCVGKLLRTVPVGTDLFTLSAIDFDAHDYITYRLTSGNEDGCFNLDPTNGVLSVGCDLTDIGVSNRSINVSSTDGTHFSDEMCMQIQLLNEGTNEAVEHIDVSNGYGTFECRETGVARRLAENLAAAERNNVDTTDKISINDLILIPSRYGENIHTPDFLDFPKELKLNESIQPGETITWIKARDRDLGYNGKLVYAISDGDYDSVFRIDSDTGELQIIGYLDKERQDEYILNITVFDLGQPQKCQSKMLPVTILDCNDNQPVFQKALASFRLSENAINGTLIFCLNATDADAGKNAKISYEMQTETNDFSVNKSTGCISSSSILDREKQEMYELKIIAKDNGIHPLSAEAVINILIEDVNDNPPIFGVQEVIFKIREDIPRGTVVASIEATDIDFGQNAEIYFSLKEEVVDEDLFKIDKYSGVIRTQGHLDYETRQIHNLIISAIDRGSPSLTSDIPVVIEIIDVNENRFAPEFDDFVYVGKIIENQEKGSIVMNITAIDLDTNSVDSKISYSIRGGDGLGTFVVNDQGSIRTLAHLDAETKTNYWLTLCAQDHAIVPLSSCVQVNIQIENENDNVPLTDKPVYYQSIFEGSPPKSKIIQLFAIDADNDPNLELKYKIISGNPEGFFEINSTTGELTTTERKLDRENQSEHILEVSISDSGSPSLSSTTTVVVSVEDINDHNPEFDQRFYKIQVPSTMAINGTIFQVQAIDNDIGENARISYFIKSGKGKNKFRINVDSGSIYLSKTLEPDTEYDLNIRADDNGNPKRSQTARLNIVVFSISKISLNPPVIKTIDNNVDITETDRPGFLVALIQATDKDGDYLWYNISDGNELNNFYIGRDNGNILLSKFLDWEAQSFFNLTISVTDGTYVVDTQLFIQVVDTNDNRPQFTEDVYNVNISENIEEEAIIMQLHATDRDEDKKIFYTLHAAQDPTSLSLFRVDSITGNVLVTQRLDYEKNTHHVLIVTAKDQGTPAKRNYAKIVITVHDHNDHYPEFTSKIIQSKIPESATIGSKVVQLYAIDQDFGKNAEVRYSIITGNIGNTFEIDSTLGIVTLVKNLNIIKMQEYMLQVKATDLGDPSLSSQMPLHIIVTMVENDPPVFLMPLNALEIYENLAMGTFVVQVEARASSSVFYDIINGNDGDFFQINPSTGVITTKNKIDYERNRFFNITVSGMNMASVSSVYTVIIHIVDVNDNSPVFLQNEYFGNISEAADIGSFIQMKDGLQNSPLLIKAIDLDVGMHGMLEYSILDGMAGAYFKIDSSTGAVKLTKRVDYESNNYFKFGIMVNDMGTPRLYSKLNAIVHIFVENVNDCAPDFKKKDFNVTLYLPTYENVVVTKVEATDADMDEINTTRYDIVDGNIEGRFAINSITGVITTRNVDRLNSFYTLHIRASDGVYSTITQVNINVETLNNTEFAFRKPKYVFSTVENSTKIVTIGLVNVVGNLLHENVEYTILNPTQMFQIGKTSGAIKTLGVMFDREVQDTYQLIIEAKSLLFHRNNNFVRRANILVEVSILDINDNCPIFVNLPYYATVSVDDVKGTVVTKVKAVDLDNFENGEVRYEMKKGNGEIFRMERKTGELILKQNVEGHNHNYELVVSAYDGAITPCSTNAVVSIKVVDRSMPLFDKQFYSNVVREDIEIFSALSVSIQAESPLKRKLIYTISNGNKEDNFEIDYRTGVIYLVGDLDYETKQVHEIIVRATDSISGIFAEVTVSITVEDVNDCYPEIEEDNYNITLSENLIIGTQVLKINASDRDMNANSELSFLIESINGRNDSDLFYIDNSEGYIYLKNLLDFEEHKFHHLIVTVKDHGTPYLASKTNVWITVNDLNDNFPRFIEPSFSSRMSATATRGQFVTIAKAYDMDYSDNERLIYKIVEGNELQIYSINQNTGIITLQNIQNLNDKQQNVLNVSVTDGVHTSYSRVKIIIMSENINGPSFHKTIYEASIAENEKQGALVITFQAIDLNIGSFSELSYDIVAEEMREYFEIEKSSGSMVSKVSFDREKRSYYEVLVRATNSGGKFGFAVVKVKIADINDNRPVFSIKEYRITIRVNVTLNSTLIKVKAMDLDEQQNSVVKYMIDHSTLNSIYSDYFSITESDGSLMILKSPNNLVHKTIQFFVRASDSGNPQLHSSVPVSIQFIESNVSVPEFEKTMINLHVLESTPPGSVLTKLKVSGNFSIKFSIATETSKFFITENGEFLLMQSLDREENEMHYIVAMCETATIPVLFTFSEIYIHVQDENDNYPKFDSSVYSVKISENVDKVTSVIKVSATDLDSGPNGDIRYYLDDDINTISNVFDIDIFSGWITLLTTLDRELVSEYYFNVLAADNGQPKHVSKVAVAVKIKDYNDNPPLFKQKQYQITVYENALPGTVLTYLLITDLDSEKSDIDYYIISGDDHSQFHIGKTGELFVSKPLDREVKSFYHLNLLVTDGKFFSESEMLVTIKDVNDNIPFCLTPRYNLVINESIAIGTPLLKIIAIDFDDVGNEKLRYYLTGNDSENFFIEKDTGILKVFKLIDREAHPKFIIEAHVQDGHQLLRECVSEVFITVNDLNDNKPVFSMNQYIVSISEDAPVQTLVTKVHASDKDFGLNRRITYSFVNKSQYFELCAETGIVTLSKPLDRESISIFNMSVKAEDHGNPKLASFAKLIINVLDINDNPPEFEMEEYRSYLLENATINAEVTKVFATSKDIGVNAEILYIITGGNDQKKFIINPKTGIIYVHGELDYEKTKSYFLTVQAVDGGTPPLSNLASVNISIVDVNDNQPKFSQNVYHVKIRENVRINEKIIQVSATDDDSEQNGLIRYNIESGDRLNQFAIENIGGVILVLNQLDRESISNYLLEVRACDSGVPELCNYVHIYVDVLDSNDNPPLFNKMNYSVVIQENKDFGYRILTFNITDADIYPNTSPYTFDIRSGNQGGFFRIEQDGTLKTAVRFNHKVCDSYILQVRVFDNGTPPQYSDTWVYVKIIEESQYPPIITPLEITVNSFEDDFAGGLLGRVYASDQDKYDSLSYGLSTTLGETYSTKKLFNISQKNGSLFAINNLDVGLYKVNVTVSDGKYTSNAIVKINVELVTAEMVKNAAIIKFSKVSTEDFILSNRKGFIRAIRAAMRCRQKDITIISIQKSTITNNLQNSTYTLNLNRPSRRRRTLDNNLDVVFAVKKQQITPNSEGYFTTEEIHGILGNYIGDIEDATNLVIEEMVASGCSMNTCVHGKCVSRVIPSKTKTSTVCTDVISFVTPSYDYVNDCKCNPGFDGKNCDESVNACSSDPCPSQKQCWPADSVKGYQCICPLGYSGQFCENRANKCQNSDCFNMFTSVSFSGKSYAHYKINKSVARNILENQFICSLKIRTVQQTATILYASGKIDYNILEVINGAIHYRFDLGSGEGVVSVSSVYICDGEWHTVTLERIFNSAKLTVDNKHVSQGSASGVNGILNIQSNNIFIGAEVRPHPSIIGFEDIQRGFVGCMADIRIALEPLPLYIAGGSSVAALKRFTNVEFTCDPLRVLIPLGVCGAQPCLNGGYCIDLGNNNFKCTCHARFTGQICENDMDPCASGPCLFGGHCENHSPSNYSCACPFHLSGRRCEYGKFCTPNPCKNGGICEEGDGVPHCMCRGYTGPTCAIDVDECDNQPCGNGATCINEAGSFRCICPSYLTGASCGDPLYSNSISTKLKNLSIEQITGIISGVTIIFAIVIIALCSVLLRRNNTNTQNRSINGKSSYKDGNLNSLIDKERYGKHNPKLINLEVNHRPISYSASTNENIFPGNTTFVNNLDILRSYGSAGDELENIPFEYQKINGTNQQININPCNLNETDASRKQDWSEQLHLKTFCESKLNNEKMSDYGLTFHRTASLKQPCGKVIQVTVPNVCDSTCAAEYSSFNHGQYHWDCSDWVGKSHNPLPDITEVPGAEIADSSSFHSNDSNESKSRNLYFVQKVGDVDPSRDITTLREDFTSDCVDSELENFIQPFQLPHGNNNSRSRLSPFYESENEDYKINTGKLYLRHPDSYLPPLTTPSENEGESSGTETYKKSHTENKALRRRKSDNSEEAFTTQTCKQSDSIISLHLCEIEDSELEEFLPVSSKNA